MSQKSPNVYKLKELATGKLTEQHLENISEKVILAREEEIPLVECPDARRPFPRTQQEDTWERKRQPEESPEDDWRDISHWLETDQLEGNMIPEPAGEETYNSGEQENPDVDCQPSHKYFTRLNKRRQAQSA